jgi:hypothetical protein
MHSASLDVARNALAILIFISLCTLIYFSLLYSYFIVSIHTGAPHSKGKVIPLQARCGPEKWVSGQQHAPGALYPRERPGTNFTGGWVGPRVGLDGRKISSPPGFDPVPSSPQSVTIPTELPGPQLHIVGEVISLLYL